MENQIASRTIFFLDRDGTLTLGSRALKGAGKFLEKLREQGKIFYILTNNSSRTPSQHHERLKRAGLNVSPENVLVSIQSALLYLKSEGYKQVYWVANEAVSKFIEGQGFTFDDSDPDCLLLTYDTELTYKKLETLTHLVRRGIPYFATHADIVCPTPKGPVPDAGTFIKVVEMTTGKVPQRVFGKPDFSFVAPVLQLHGLRASDAVIVGDRLYTDIKLADGNDMISVLVLTGETTREAHDASETKADIVVDSLEDLIRLL